MNDKKQSSFDASNWFELQEKYIDAMLAFNTGNPFHQNANPFHNSIWINAMNDWWSSVKPESNEEKSSLYEKILQQCRYFYCMNEQFSKLIEGLENAKNKDEDVIAFINKTFRDIELIFDQVQTNFSWSHFIDTGEQTIEQLKNVMAGMSGFSSDILNNINPEARKLRAKLFSIPGIGYSREQQDKYQKLIRLWAEFLDNYQAYQSVMDQLNSKSLERMRKKIVKMSKDGEYITSMRQVYDLWIDCSETVYGDYVCTDEYAELNANLVNSLMAFKQKSQAMSNELCMAMNLPDRQSVNELEKRQYETRKQIKDLQAELKFLKDKSGGSSASKKKPKKVTENIRQKTTKKATTKTDKIDSSQAVKTNQAKKKAARKKTATTKKKVQSAAKNRSSKKNMIKIKF